MKIYKYLFCLWVCSLLASCVSTREAKLISIKKITPESEGWFSYMPIDFEDGTLIYLWDPKIKKYVVNKEAMERRAQKVKEERKLFQQRISRLCRKKGKRYSCEESFFDDKLFSSRGCVKGRFYWKGNTSNKTYNINIVCSKKGTMKKITQFYHNGNKFKVITFYKNGARKIAALANNSGYLTGKIIYYPNGEQRTVHAYGAFRSETGCFYYDGSKRLCKENEQAHFGFDRLL